MSGYVSFRTVLQFGKITIYQIQNCYSFFHKSARTFKENLAIYLVLVEIVGMLTMDIHVEKAVFQDANQDILGIDVMFVLLDILLLTVPMAKLML